ncbi:hypothetical protein L226DRAFT_537209 [Lentinus tigrinus ALCF2SS1-7]|nr:hypothetical protein L226DRAFT_537209 [Lentinus tigrinus ALCF2SS1-7]
MNTHRQPNPNHNPNNHRSRGGTANQPAPAPPQPQPPPFRWSSSLLTMFTLISAFVVLCTVASNASTLFALKAARPMYALYPSLVAAMLVGGMCALICYVPTMLAVFCFQVVFGTDIRKAGTPPEGTPTGYGEMVMSLLHDGASTIKLALVVAPIYVMAVGNQGMVESRSLEAAAGGQLAAAIMTLRILLAGMKEIWSLVPLVVFRWDRDARR